MDNASPTQLLATIARELTKGHWKGRDAARYAPMLFSLVPPSERVRRAVAALHHQQNGVEQLKAIQTLIHKTADVNNDYSPLTEHVTDPLLPDTGKGRNSDKTDHELLLLLLAERRSPVAPTVNINIDLNALYERIFAKECDDEFTVQHSAEAVLTEYVTTALLTLDASLMR